MPSPEIPRSDPDLVEMKVGVDDVARGRHFGLAARIGAGTAVMQFVAASMRQWKCAVAMTDRSEKRSQVRQMEIGRAHV